MSKEHDSLKVAILKKGGDVVLGLRFLCSSVEELISLFSGMYLPAEIRRHWIITTEENPSAFIWPNVSTRLNKLYLKNISNRDKKAIEEFAKENKMQIIECQKFDIKKRILTCKNVGTMLTIFKAMYSPDDSVRHWVVLPKEDSKVLIQPFVSTGLDAFQAKNLSDEDRETIKEFVLEHQIKLIECSTFEFDE